MMRLLYYLFCMVIVCLFGCSNNSEHAKAVIDRSSNAGELKAVLEKFGGDKTHFRQAEFLIANGEFKYSLYGPNSLIQRYHTIADSIEQAYSGVLHNKDNNLMFRSSGIPSTHSVQDIDRITADSLIESIEFANRVWKDAPWTKNYPPHYFTEYVLPWRVFNEPLEYNWRKDAYDKFFALAIESGETQPDKLCSYINDRIVFINDHLFFNTTTQSYTSAAKYRRGSCNDRTVYAAYVLRSLGLPATFDFIPQWGDHNIGHSMTALIMPDGSTRAFNASKDILDDYRLSFKTPKIYRKVFNLQRDNILWANREKEIIPELFSSFDLEDVSRSYNIHLADLRIEPRFSSTSKIAYLCVSSFGKWRPIAYAENKTGTILFKDIGTGVLDSLNTQSSRENTRDGVLYLPATYGNNGSSPLSYPVIFKGQCVHELIPDYNNTETVIITRKYPRRPNMVKYGDKLIGGRIDLSNDANFNDFTTIHIIEDVPASRMEEIAVSAEGKYRYARFFMARGGITIAQLQFRDAQYRIIDGKAMACDILKDEPEINNVFDGRPLTFFQTPSLLNVWVGLEFKHPTSIASVEYRPRNDDNDIAIGDDYELYYWDNQWVSLGVQKASGHELVYDNVPKNSLLWVKNHTKGREERPFTYENRKQIWW